MQKILTRDQPELKKVVHQFKQNHQRKKRNWRTSANPIQEVIRAPRGPPPSTGNGETKGPVGFQRLGSIEQSQPPALKPIIESPPTVPAIPKPITPVSVRKQLGYPMQVLPGARKPVEMVCVVDPSRFYVRLSEDSTLLSDMIANLNAVYSGSFDVDLLYVTRLVCVFVLLF